MAEKFKKQKAAEEKKSPDADKDDSARLVEPKTPVSKYPSMISSNSGTTRGSVSVASNIGIPQI
jgi:hypothetical protein